MLRADILSLLQMGIKSTFLELVNSEKFDFHNFCPTWVICIPNESLEHSKFDFVIKNDICYGKFGENQLFHNFGSFSMRFFFRNENFSEI